MTSSQSILEGKHNAFLTISTKSSDTVFAECASGCSEKHNSASGLRGTRGPLRTISDAVVVK